MKYIGAHVSASGGVENAVTAAQAIGASAFALFTRNQKSWASKPLSASNISLFKERLAAAGISPEMVLPHDSYLINLGCPASDNLLKSRQAFLDEMERAEQLGVNKLNFHPGSHLNLCSPEQCLERIAEGLNLVIEKTKSAVAVIENTAGQGTNMGYQWEHIARIISLVNDKSRVAVCIDTCHTLAAGYDLVSEAGYEQTMEDFDRIIGLQYLKGIHLNDSKKGCGSRVDRHESLGKGFLGEAFFKRFMHDERFDNMPIILETPDESLWPQEIEWLKSL